MPKTTEVSNSPDKNKKGGTALTIILAILLIIAVVICVGLFVKQSNKNNDPNSVASQEEDAKIVKEVGNIMILPEETPSMATVLDVTKLDGQPFFKNAVNGDKLMLFTESQKAILYRPSTKQIVEVMPLIMDQANTPTLEGMETSTTPNTTTPETSNPETSTLPDNTPNPTEMNTDPNSTDTNITE